MRTIVLGDSFAGSIRNTYLEDLRIYFNLDIIKHESFIGGCEYYLYEQVSNWFKPSISTRPKIDLIIFCHTETQRLANIGHYPINIVNVYDPNTSLPPVIKEAALQYYSLLYHEKFHGVVHDLLIKEIQKICTSSNVKQIHIQSFNNKVTMTNGLWFRGGLHNLAATQDTDYYKQTNLLNHFTQENNRKLSNWLIPHIEQYFKSEKDLKIVDLNVKEIISS